MVLVSAEETPSSADADTRPEPTSMEHSELAHAAVPEGTGDAAPPISCVRSGDGLPDNVKALLGDAVVAPFLR